MTDNQWDEKKVSDQLIKMMEDLLQTYRAKDMRDKSQITVATDLYDDLQVDSLELMDLIAAIETKFKLSIKPEDLASKRKVKDVVEYITQMTRESKT